MGVVFKKEELEEAKDGWENFKQSLGVHVKICGIRKTEKRKE